MSLKLSSLKYKYLLLGSLVLLGLVVFKQIAPYVGGILGACTLYIILRGQMAYMVERWRLNRIFVASILTFEALLFFLIPLTIFGIMMIDTLSGIKIDPGLINEKLKSFAEFVTEHTGYEIFTPENLQFLPKIGGFTLQFLATNSYSIIINGLVVILVLYYMLLNYDDFERGFREILPFKRENKIILEREIVRIIKANAIGIPLLAIIQGGFAYGGYAFLGVEKAFFYAVLTAFSTIIPIVGTMIIWIPLGLSFILRGDWVNGMILLIYGFIVIGGVDNLARFMLQKQIADIHPLITIFGVVIGLQIFGFWGVIFGPLLLSVFILLFNMYRHEYIKGSLAQPSITNDKKHKKKNKKKLLFGTKEP